MSMIRDVQVQNLIFITLSPFLQSSFENTNLLLYTMCAISIMQFTG